MRAVDIIRKKRDREPLTPEEIQHFVQGATTGGWEKYQVTAMLMAIVCRDMTPDETAELTGAMVHSGERLDLSDIPGIKVDKHSTGGVGDKTSLILAPLSAACGAVVPMMSGRGLGHTGGTLDKLEAIPGFDVRLSLEQLRAALRSVGCALIGQTAEIAPADKVLYSLRDVTATVESIPLISASIMSKKIAEGIGGLILDVKCGNGAFMKTRADAKALAQSLINIGNAQGVKTTALLTAMEQPLGQMVGNSLEVIESIETLKGNGPKDLEDLSVQLAARMVHLAKLTDSHSEAEAKVRAALTSGRGLEKFRAIIEQQKGDPSVIDNYSILPTAPHQELYRAEQSGALTKVDALQIGVASMMLGAGRERSEDDVKKDVGIRVLVEIGQEVKAGDPLLELYYREPADLKRATDQLNGAFAYGNAKGSPELILETLE